MYRKSALLLIIIVLLFVVTICKKDNPAEPPVKNTIFITVGSGTSPRYSWLDVNGKVTRIYRLTVYEKTNLGDHIWGIQTAGGEFDGISSPVTHGTIPSGAEKYGIRDVTVLPDGFTYRVMVQKMNGEQGWKDFSR
ncbi:hypothetical protein AMJ80_06435 [bacterium SM23_31]|nr:MAG: hypothetical protein AMJ80_06435 [bacterium SM23_31]